MKGKDVGKEREVGKVDRPRQERGIDIKVGFGRIKIGNVWKSWAEVEKKGEEKREKRRKELKK